MGDPSLLAVCDERAGVRNQAVGLAEAVAAVTGARMRTLVVSSTDTKRFSGLMRTPPDVAVGCGRAAMAELSLLRRAGAKTVYVQDPRRGHDRFDLVVAPEHDKVSAPNAIAMVGGPHRVSEARLDAARKEAGFGDVGALPRPRVAILLGGRSKRHDTSPDTTAAHVSAMADVLARGGSLMVSVSRRSDAKALAEVRALAVRHPGRIVIYAGEGPNPYFAYLAHADAVMVTEDSANMLVEACATRVPVYRLPMAGSAGKLEHLYASLRERRGVERWTDGASLSGDREPMRETERVAREVAGRLGLRLSGLPAG